MHMMRYMRREKPEAFRKVATLVALLGVLVASAAHAGQTYVVGNDRGGYLHDRLIELENLQANGVRVEIRGRLCYSTCTMFLGLPGTCVEPGTTFGFHGPSRRGRPLTQTEFDYFSTVMSSFYPEPLKAWFLEKGRNRLTGVYKIKGRDIIRMGIPECRSV